MRISVLLSSSSLTGSCETHAKRCSLKEILCRPSAGVEVETCLPLPVLAWTFFPHQFVICPPFTSLAAKYMLHIYVTFHYRKFQAHVGRDSSKQLSAPFSSSSGFQQLAKSCFVCTFPTFPCGNYVKGKHLPPVCSSSRTTLREPLP